MVSPMDVYRLLPKTNCGECGEKTCMAFAFKVIEGEKNVDECKHLLKSQREELMKLLEPLKKATETGLIVNEEKCVGCANCIVVCPVHASEDPEIRIGRGPTIDPIMRVENGVVKVVNIQLCRRYGKERILCNVCRENCPSDAITFIEG